MFALIKNANENELITSFNKKLLAYNTAAQNKDTHLQRCLLQEITYFVEVNDHVLDMGWSVINQELKEFTGVQNVLPGLATERALLNTPTVFKPVMSADKWNKRTNGEISFSALRRIRNPVAIEIGNDLKKIEREQTKGIDAYYAFKRIQTKLLHELNFGVLSQTEQKVFRSLLNRINIALKKSIENEPILNARYHDHESLAVALREELVSQDNETKEKIIHEFFQVPALSHSKKALPSLSHYVISRLGGANNKNWMITNQKSGEVFTIQASEIKSNHSLLARLSQTTVNEYLSQSYATFQADPLEIVVTEFAKQGDMRSYRENNQQVSNAELIDQTTGRFIQIADFCKKMIENGAMHTDIKTPNFLFNDQNKLRISDQKTFAQIDSNGKIKSRDLYTTPPYQPPELDKITNKELDAEKFMSYQMGLALYDYLVLPVFSDDPNEKAWSEQHPLDFETPPVFKTEPGKAMQALIESATNPNPEQRLGLSDALIQLKTIQREYNLVQKNHTDHATALPLGLSTANPKKPHDLSENIRNIIEYKTKFKNIQAESPSETVKPSVDTHEQENMPKHSK